MISFGMVLLIWYILGVVSCTVGVMLHDRQLTVGDMVLNLTVGGMGGIISFIVVLIMICSSTFSNVVIWRAKNDRY